MKLIALDVGERRTGVAFFDSQIDFVIPLDTIHHQSDRELMDAIEMLLQHRAVKDLVIGLPLLLSGVEGSQAKYAKQIGATLVSCGYAVKYIDERFTTDRQTPSDGDAKAACIVLTTFLQQRESRSRSKKSARKTK
jgi:putative Holliday junction resolvase